MGLDICKVAKSIFVYIGSMWGIELVNAVLSDTYGSMGQPEKAPNRPVALAAMKDLVKAVQEKNVHAYNRAIAKYQTMRSMIPDSEFWELLAPAFEKDAECAIAFLQEQGFDFKAKPQGQEADQSTQIKSYDHTLFYAQTRTFGGMGFGPQFRSVYPFRTGTPGVDGVALHVAQLCETEDWELKLGW